MSVAPTFGTGGSEPYATALRQTPRRGDSTMLYLQDARSAHATPRVLMDVSRWNADADSADLSLLASVTGPVLDIGSGPGRMVRAAMQLGMVALGIDVSPTAVEVARELGGSFIEASIFEHVPAEGKWQTALLVDGNVGIGGDIPALLWRCRELLAPTGEIVVELDNDPAVQIRYVGQVVDSEGRGSAEFPWAQIGLDRITAMLPSLKLRLAQSWEIDGRSFCRLAKIR